MKFYIRTARQIALGIISLGLFFSVGCEDVANSKGEPTVYQPPSPITIENLANNDTVTYQLLFVRGSVPDTVGDVSIQNKKRTRAWPAHSGGFACFTYLEEGRNDILLNTPDHAPDTLTIYYAPRTEETHRVRLVYCIPSDGEGEFQSVVPGEPNDLETAVQRLNLAALMIQTAYAEMLYNSGEPRLTFELIEDDDGDHVFVERLGLTMEELRNYRLVCDQDGCEDGPEPYKSTYDLWDKVAAKMGQYMYIATTKNLVYTGFTRFEKTETGSILYAGATLGGGHTGTAQGNALYLYPSDLDELIERMYDTRTEAEYDMDAYGSAPFWSAYFVHLGGSTHELCHTFDLGHSNAHMGLMGLGFYNFQRLYMPVDGNLSTFPADQRPIIARTDENGESHLGKILASPWFNDNK